VQNLAQACDSASPFACVVIECRASVISEVVAKAATCLFGGTSKTCVTVLLAYMHSDCITLDAQV